MRMCLHATHTQRRHADTRTQANTHYTFVLRTSAGGVLPSDRERRRGEAELAAAAAAGAFAAYSPPPDNSSPKDTVPCLVEMRDERDEGCGLGSEVRPSHELTNKHYTLETTHTNTYGHAPAF